MQKKISLLLFFLLITYIPVLSQSKVKEVNEPEGGFSYFVPASWIVSSMEGMPYQIARDKPVNGFTPNINILKEKNKFTFEEYYKANIAQLKEFYTDYKEITTEEFSTTAGLKGKKHLCSDKQVGKNLFQVFYFFESKDKSKIIITGSSLIEDKDKYLPVFDSIAKSFKTIKYVTISKISKG